MDTTKKLKRFELSANLAAFIVVKQAGIRLTNAVKLPGAVFRYCLKAGTCN